MSNQPLSRRRALKTMAATAAAVLAGPSVSPAARSRLHLAGNQYPWTTYWRRRNRNFDADLDATFKDIAASGLDGFEPLATSPAQIEKYIAQLKTHSMAMRSLYVNSVLHEPDQLKKSIDDVLAIASVAKKFGTKIIVVNPTPIQWGGPQNKTDTQLDFQARSIDTLGARLREMGLMLSYHFHDVEMRNDAREFTHTLSCSDVKNVTICFDAHWVYRGSGNSASAVFKLLELWGRRITELHLRQSKDNVWTESFGPGDIDYKAVAAHLQKIKVKPHIVLEQAVEQATPKTISAVEAHKKSCQYAREVFAAFA